MRLFFTMAADAAAGQARPLAPRRRPPAACPPPAGQPRPSCLQLSRWTLQLAPQALVVQLSPLVLVFVWILQLSPQACGAGCSWLQLAPQVHLFLFLPGLLSTTSGHRRPAASTHATASRLLGHPIAGGPQHRPAPRGHKWAESSAGGVGEAHPDL